MEEGLRNQNRLYQEIQNLLKSDPKSADINEKWAEFENNHIALGKFTELANHEYITKDAYGVLKKYIEDCMARNSSSQVDSSSSEKQAAAVWGWRQEIDVFLDKNVNEALHKGVASDLKKMLHRLQRMPEIFTMKGEILDKSFKTTKYYESTVNKIHDAIVDVQDMLDTISNKHEHEYPLPKMEIPKFYGDQNKWLVFSDVFRELVHNRPELSTTKKFQYLKLSLCGDALKTVNHLMDGSAENYFCAWELIENRYENNRKIFSENLEKLISLPKLKEEESHLKRFIDTVNEAVHQIKKKGECDDKADTIIAQLILMKFERSTMHQYDQLAENPRDVQNLVSVMDFLERLYVTISGTSSTPSSSTTRSTASNNAKSTEKLNCGYCKFTGHDILACRKFKMLTSEKRNEHVKAQKLCGKCLLHDNSKYCYKNWECATCENKNHHTLLHNEKIREKIKERAKEKVSSNMVAENESRNNTLLATAIIKVKNLDGHEECLRAMIDSGSQKTLISEEAAQLLRLPRKQEKTEISGLSSTIVAESDTKIKLYISSTISKGFKTTANALVVPTLHKSLPNEPIDQMKDVWRKLNLADPTFNKPGRIDLIIGLDLYPKIIKPGMRKHKHMVAQNTTLGWIISGGTYKTKKCPVSAIATIDLSNLNRFWEFEEPEAEDETEAKACEELFMETTCIAEDNRYVVQIPFKKDNMLGSSRKQAMARFMNLEKRFIQNSDLKAKYSEFISEYLKLGHMRKVKSSSEGYFMPHQAVIRESSLTTKLRVVFDASAKTTNGRSLNDVMMVGPKQQKDIFDILVKWRQWRYVISADIEKMYRQIWIAENHRKYQNIFWRDDSKIPVEQYELATLTYGTAAATFLSTRVLAHIAERIKEINFKLYSIIKNDFYMDDLLTGADTIEECQKIQLEITKELSKFGFHLRKWVTNDIKILENLTSDENNMIIQINENEAVKTLGLQWDPRRDIFFFKFDVIQKEKLTKRLVLSTLAKIFDPLGWLSPVTVTGKLFVQRLWSSSLSWDAQLSEELKKEWMQYICQLKRLEDVQIPRWVFTTGLENAQLHGFSDASDSAYAAAVYVKAGTRVIFLTSKTKINPAKNKKTIPKLELCGAHLLAKLLAKVVDILAWSGSIFGWCDSQITLAWINNNKSKERFVRSRVGDIKKNPNISWHYVKSEDNPADLASRGVKPEKMLNSSPWWNGPSWLKLDESQWPEEDICKETSILVVAATYIEAKIINDLIEKYSSITKLERILAYILRFISKLKEKRLNLPNYLTTDELKRARTLIINSQQSKDFGYEISNLKKGKKLEMKNKLLSLNPFLDKDGILRVGGRLQNSSLTYEEKHPVILKKSHLANLIIAHAHKITLHGGISVMKVQIRRYFWIIGLRNLIKFYVHKCVTCTRYRQESANQIMGNLPEARVTAVLPFVNTGVDYAGPINIKCSQGRGRKTYKGYVAVFVCMTTRSIHLELVSDLTSEAFLAALKRFFSKRGKSSNIYSDNGTNFVGASKILDDDLKKAIKNNNKLAPTLEADGIRWHFIPPAAPHFGGIWEAGVKSCKFHLKRVIGDTVLTYEEMATLLSQIEAVLNSRPLYATGDDVEDIDVLTPGHFLIGRPLLSAPESMIEDRLGSLDRWKLIQKMRRDFWKRWKEEYLSSLQKRNKWKQMAENLKKNQVVLIKNENTPPAKWPMGLIVNVNTGKDDKVRVIDIKTKAGLIKRPITKVCPLSCENIEMQTNVSLQDGEKPASRLSTRKTGANAFLLIAILVNFFMVLTANPIDRAKFSNPKNYTSGATITTLNENTAVYLDNLGAVEVSTSSWNLVIYYDLKIFMDSFGQVINITNKSLEVCGKIGEFEEHCKDTIARIKERIKIVQKYNQLFSLSHLHRQKRYINFVGSFYHLLFGLMDNDDREEVEHNMRTLLEDQYNLKDLIKNQTSTVDASINLFSKSAAEVNATFATLHERIDNITQMVKQQMFIYKESIKFFIISNQKGDQLEEVERTQSQIIHLLMDINHGKISPDLLKPDQLSREIIKIKEWLPGNMKLPGSKNNQLSTILKMMKAKAIIVDDKLVIRASIPLISSKSANVFKVVPMPVQQESNTVMASIPNPYLVYSYEADVYHLMSEIEFHGCKEYNDQQFFCDGGWAWQDANKNVCEVAPLKPHKDVNCNVIEAINKNIWVKLSSKQKWLFRTTTNSTLHVYCDLKQQYLIKLPKQGVLTLDTGCSAQEGKTILPASLITSVTTEGSFGTFLTNEVSYNTTNFLKPLGSTVIDHSSEIHKLKEEIKALKATDIHLKGLNFHHASGHTALGISTLAVIIILLYGCYQMTLRRRLLAIQFNSPRQNSPRQNVQN